MGSEGMLHNGMGGKWEVVGIRLEKGRGAEGRGLATAGLKIQPWESGNQCPRNMGCSQTGAGRDWDRNPAALTTLPKHLPGKFQHFLPFDSFFPVI